jgi:hypothetical protein
VSSRYGRSVTRVPAQAGVNRFRRYPLVGPLFSPWWLAVVLVIVMGAGVTATAFTLSSSSTSASMSGTPPSAVPSGVPPSALSANPGGASAGHGAFNDVSCDSGTQCVAVGADSSGVGVVATSTNDGSSFTSVVLPSGTPALSSVSCVEPGTCVAVGGDDILHSGDNGSPGMLSKYLNSVRVHLRPSTAPVARVPRCALLWVLSRSRARRSTRASSWFPTTGGAPGRWTSCPGPSRVFPPLLVRHRPVASRWARTSWSAATGE